MLKILNETVSVMITIMLITLLSLLTINFDSLSTIDKLQPSATDLYFKLYTNNTNE